MSERAKVWYSRAEKISSLSSLFFDYVEKRKLSFLDNSYKENDSLYNRLNSFEREIENIDTMMTKEFKTFIDSLSTGQDSKIKSKEISANISLLTNLQNRIAILENMMVAYCNNNVGSGSDSYYLRIPLINQNLNHLKINEELEVNVGIGYLSYPSTPSIHINGDSITVGKAGMYNYKLKISGKAGKYSVPIKIEYYDYNSKKVTITKTIEYEIDN